MNYDVVIEEGIKFIGNSFILGLAFGWLMAFIIIAIDSFKVND